MAKNYRGNNIKRESGWRGICPLCKRTGVKLLWEKVIEEDKKIKVCKRCGE